MAQAVPIAVLGAYTLSQAAWRENNGNRGIPPSYPSSPSYPLLSECPRGYDVPTPPDPAKAKTPIHHIGEGDRRSIEGAGRDPPGGGAGGGRWGFEEGVPWL